MVRFIDQTMANLARLTIKILVKSTKTSFFLVASVTFKSQIINRRQGK